MRLNAYDPTPKAIPTMQLSTSYQHAITTVATATDFLPGLAPPHGVDDQPGQHPVTPGSGWWVKRSTRQTVDAAGQPAGFRHQLMLGRKTVKTGTGADCGRTFSQQADFLNSRDSRDLQDSPRHASAEAPDNPHG